MRVDSARALGTEYLLLYTEAQFSDGPRQYEHSYYLGFTELMILLPTTVWKMVFFPHRYLTTSRIAETEWSRDPLDWKTKKLLLIANLIRLGSAEVARFGHARTGTTGKAFGTLGMTSRGPRYQSKKVTPPHQLRWQNPKAPPLYVFTLILAFELLLCAYSRHRDTLCRLP